MSRMLQIITNNIQVRTISGVNDILGKSNCYGSYLLGIEFSYMHTLLTWLN